MSKAANVSYVDFQKKKNISEKDIYNTCYDKWLDIKRACDPSKTIAYEAITFIAAIEFLFSKNPDEVIFNSKFLQSKCKQGARQRSRFLAQLADLYEIKSHTSYSYKGKEYHFVYSAKRSKDSLKILKNPKEFYRKSAIKLVETPDKNDLHTSQKCLVYPTNLSTIHTTNSASSQVFREHRNLIEEDKNSNKSFLSSKNIILKQEINNIITRARDPLQKNEENRDAPSALSSLTEQAEGAELVPKELACLFAPPIFPVNNLSKAEELPPANNNNEIHEKPTMNEKETLTASDRKMLLSKALLGAFGQEDADLLQDTCEFIELEADKVKITIGNKKSLSDLEKEKIRKSLKSVYGEDVRIVTGKRETQDQSVTNCSQLTQETKPPRPELIANVRTNNSEWFVFRQNLIRVLTKRHEEKIAQHIVKNWFDRLGISELSSSQKLVMVADPFYIHWIENNYDHVVEEAVCLGNFTVELHYEGNKERPRVYCKELIKRGKK
jgi:hypothetical protein